MGKEKQEQGSQSDFSDCIQSYLIKLIHQICHLSVYYSNKVVDSAKPNTQKCLARKTVYMLKLFVNWHTAFKRLPTPALQ